MKMQKVLSSALCVVTFGLAAQEEKPLPELNALVQRLRDRAKANESKRLAYCWVEEDGSKMMNSKGKLLSEGQSKYEVFNFPKGQVKRLIERDGKPLSEEKAKDEDERVQKKAKKLDDPEGGSGKVRILLGELLKVAEIKKMERVRHDGMILLALEYGPKKGAKTSGLKEKFLSKTEGKILVDEATDQVVETESRLLENVSAGLGTLSFKAPTVFKQTYAQVEPGLWMPVKSYTTMTVRLTFWTVQNEMTTTYRDYHKFSVDGIEGKAVPVESEVSVTGAKH